MTLPQNIYFPALNPIAKDLGVDVSLINLTLTTYMIFQVNTWMPFLLGLRILPFCKQKLTMEQGIAPTIFGDFGDMAGRRPAFIIAVLIYIFGKSR